MEVTKTNLKAFLPLVQEALEEADFVAIDTELTGLNSENKEHAFDTLEERYQKLREGCGKFLIIQFGLSTFRYHPDHKKYTHKDFNFYVFPRPYSKNGPDTCFLCQASSLDYLVQHGFDFNKLLHEGIPYLAPLQEQKVKDALLEKHKEQQESLSPTKAPRTTKDQKLMNIPDEQKPFLQNIHNQIDSLIHNKAESVLKLPACNAYQRKLIYQSVSSKYPDGLDLSSTMDEYRQTYITVVKATEEQRKDLLRVRQMTDLDDLDEAVGFRKVLELITKSNKLVIGHNMLLDMMHIINQFYHPLPETLDDFKELLSCNFPKVLDTKTMSSLPPFKEYFSSTALGLLLAQLQDKAFGLPTIDQADGFKGYDLSESREHEAGYDAFITGLCFVGLSKRLALNVKASNPFVSSNSKHLRPFINRIYIMRHYDITSLNLTGPDPEPSREHVFYVTFPREWKTVDLVELFLPFGQIYVSWLSENSALVGLKHPKLKHNVMKTLVHKENFYKVKPYCEYLEMQRNLKSPSTWQPTSVPASDSLLPSKKRRNSGDAGKRSIETIPEEEEEDVSHSSKSPKISSPSSKKTPVSSPSSKKTSRRPMPGANEPNSKRTKIDEESPNEPNQPKKIFDEPNVW